MIMTLRTGVLVSNVPFRMNSARSNDRVSSAKPGRRKNGQNNNRRGGDRRTASALSQRPKTMKAAYAPVPSIWSLASSRSCRHREEQVNEPRRR
jgi:hypothetical protein